MDDYQSLSHTRASLSSHQIGNCASPRQREPTERVSQVIGKHERPQSTALSLNLWQDSLIQFRAYLPSFSGDIVVSSFPFAILDRKF